MNSGFVEDTLFLSVQADSSIRLATPLFGKVLSTPCVDAKGSIFYLSPIDCPPLNTLAHYHAVICNKSDHRLDNLKLLSNTTIIVVADDIVFSHGDVISISERGRIHRYFRAKSNNNALLVTEVCNNLCIMCPQPPKPEDIINHEHTKERILKTIELIDDSNPPSSLCITGGEPTMLENDLLIIIDSITTKTPSTLVHLLTNGRHLSDENYTAQLARSSRNQLLAGIPLFGHVSEIHDYVVQAQGAFDQTMAGLLNCYKNGINVELRVVLNKVTVKYLTELAHFISRNLFFVKHVALMGMENMGYAKLNRAKMFIDPWDYRDILSSAVEIFNLYDIDVRIFNLPLCIVNPDTRKYCKQSISDFKNSWNPICESCSSKEECCGFFTSTTDKFWLSKHIQPLDMI